MEGYLSEKGIEFETKDVSDDQQALMELVRKYKSNSTPTIVVDDQVMIGFDPERLDHMLAE